MRERGDSTDQLLSSLIIYATRHCTAWASGHNLHDLVWEVGARSLIEML